MFKQKKKKISPCNKSKATWVEIEIKGKGILVCLAKGQTPQLLSKERLFEDNYGDTNIRREGEGWPRRICHTWQFRELVTLLPNMRFKRNEGTHKTLSN